MTHAIIPKNEYTTSGPHLSLAKHIIKRYYALVAISKISLNVRVSLDTGSVQKPEIASHKA